MLQGSELRPFYRKRSEISSLLATQFMRMTPGAAVETVLAGNVAAETIQAATQAAIGVVGKTLSGVY